MSTENLKNMSALDMFTQVQETYEDAKRKSNEESRKKTPYLRFNQDGVFTVRILPLAPVTDENGEITLPRKGYEYPTKELVLKIIGKDNKGKDKPIFVNVTNVKYSYPSITEDLIDLYVRLACEKYNDDADLCKKIKGTSFNGGLKYDSKRCMYVLDYDKRDDGIQVLQLSYSQYKELEERKMDLWTKLLKKNPKTLCPLSSIANAYPLEIKRKTNNKKTEYSFNIDTTSDVDELEASELEALLEMPRLPEAIYRYSRYHLEATIEYLKQYDEKMQIDIMDCDEIKDCIDQIKMCLPADDRSHFTLNGDENKNTEGVDELDNLWKMHEKIEDAGLDDKSEEGMELRTSIREFIEAQDLDITISRKTSNYDLLMAIEDELGTNTPKKSDDEGVDDEPEVPASSRRKHEDPEEDPEPEEDDEPEDPSPRRRRNEDTNEPAARPSRRGSRPSRRG